MKNRIKLSIAIISLIVIIFFSILIGITPTNIYAAGDKGLKEEACDAVGCPNGPRNCMDIETNLQVSVGIISAGATVTIYCYEPEPNME